MIHCPAPGRGGAYVDLSTRNTRGVLDDHLACRKERDVESDLKRNYASTVVVLTSLGRFTGHDGVRHTASTLHRYASDATYEYLEDMVVDDVAFLTWRVRSAAGGEIHGGDTFLVRNGLIVLQTIHHIQRTIRVLAPQETAAHASASMAEPVIE